MLQKTAVFASAFKEAAGDGAIAYQEYVRFVAITLVIVGMMIAINHFLDEKAKASDDYFVVFVSRLIRIVIGLTLFIGFLMT